MRLTFLSALLCWLTLGCGNATQPTDQPAEPDQPRKVEPPSAADVPEEGEDKPAPPTPKVETKTYVAEVHAPDKGKTPAAGEMTELLVTIRPQNGWHMNHDFPTSVKLVASDTVTSAAGKLQKKDAKRFDDEGADFELPVEFQKDGKQEAIADLSFAVCTEQTCLPEKLQLALTLDVGVGEEKTP